MYDRLNYNKKLTPRSRDLRNFSTLAEVLLWSKLKESKFLGFQFNRQYVIHHYIVDFYCKKLQLVIEIDGSSHDNKYEYDTLRQKELETLGVCVLRFRNREVRYQMSRVLSKIKKYITEHTRREVPPLKGVRGMLMLIKKHKR